MLIIKKSIHLEWGLILSSFLIVSVVRHSKQYTYHKKQLLLNLAVSISHILLSCNIIVEGRKDERSALERFLPQSVRRCDWLV